jgi:Zn-dependent M28 family amino/carboxypeptidase
MVSRVNWTDVSTRIQWLADFGTRFSYAGNHLTVANAIAGEFTALGLAPNVRSFTYDGTTMYNVIATHTGSVYPYKLWVICGHFDSVSGDPYNSAPGADDNGTGTAAVLTAAEILTQYEFEYSVRFICFGGEEQGLRGSQAYAAMAAAQGMDIQGVLNFDMMGYWEPGVEKDLEIETNIASIWLANIITNCADIYTDAVYQLHINDYAWWGDHASFWDEGFYAVNHEEAYDWGDPDFNPYYHTTNDVLAYVGEDFTIDNIQVGVAALATLAGPVPETAPAASQPTVSDNAWIGAVHTSPSTMVLVRGIRGERSARVGVYDVRGRRVNELLVALHGGEGELIWDGTDDSGLRAASGVYFFKLEDFPGVPAAKFVRLK